MIEFIDDGRKYIVTRDGREIGLEVRPRWRGMLVVWDTIGHRELRFCDTLEEAREYIEPRFWG